MLTSRDRFDLQARRVSELHTPDFTKLLHTDADDIELKAALQELLLNLRSDAVEADVTSGEDCVSLRHCHGHTGAKRNHTNGIR